MSLCIMYCGDCGAPYLTDNDGSRTPMCDLCRAEMGYAPRAFLVPDQRVLERETLERLKRAHDRWAKEENT